MTYHIANLIEERKCQRIQIQQIQSHNSEKKIISVFNSREIFYKMWFSLAY